MRQELRTLLCPTGMGKFGALMGRCDKGSLDVSRRVRDVEIPINSGGYDAGGAYWGLGETLRCRFQVKGGILTYREFYRGKKV